MIRIKVMVVAAVGLFLVSALLSVGASVWYTNTAISHECAALRLLTDPSTHLRNDRFNAALIQWRNQDHC